MLGGVRVLSLRNLTSCRNVRRVPTNHELLVLNAASGSKSVVYRSLSRVDELMELFYTARLWGCTESKLCSQQMTHPHYAGGQVDKSAHVCEYEVVFTDLASSGFETSDCRILAALIPQLECVSRRHIGWIVGLLMKVPSNNKLGPRVRQMTATVDLASTWPIIFQS